MPVVSCPHCSNPVHAPPDWTRTGYTCPHCRKAVPARPSPPPDEDDEEEDDFTPPPPRPTARRRPTGNPFVDFLTFRLMITPVLIQIAFWLGTLTCVMLGARMMIGSFGTAEEPRPALRDARENPFGNPERPRVNAKPEREFSFSLFAGGFALTFFGPLLIRIACELDIILFKIHDELKESNNRQRYGRR